MGALKLVNENEVKVISTREIAEMMEIEHKLILRKLEGSGDGSRVAIIDVLVANQMVLNDYFVKNTYIATNGKENKEYLCTKMGCEMLANKFTGEKGILFTAKYVKRFNEMEDQLSQPKLPTTYKEALLALVEEVEKNEKLELENQQLTTEVVHKENVIIGLVDNISTSEKRQRISQIIKYGSKKYADRYSLLYTEFESKYHVDVNRRMNNAKERGEIKKSVNKMGYICDVMDMTNQLYEVCCKVFENDVEKLKDEWFGAIERENR